MRISDWSSDVCSSDLETGGEEGMTDEAPPPAAAAVSDFLPDPPIRCRRFRIGADGAGFIMADVQLAAYARAGFPVAAIASRTPSRAAAAARRWGIPKVHETPEALTADPDTALDRKGVAPGQGVVRRV